MAETESGNCSLTLSVADPGGVRRFRPNPPFWLAMLICTVKDPGFMEPPFLPFSYNKTGSSLPRQRF